MDKFKQNLYRFMYGRYGIDKLYGFCMGAIMVLLAISLITSVCIPNATARFIVQMAITLLDVAIISWSTFRFLSKNIAKRRRENEMYLKMVRALGRFFSFNTSRRSKSGNADNFQFVFRDCTKCGSTLRLPRKEGRNSVKCPRCSHRFNVVVKKMK